MVERRPYAGPSQQSVPVDPIAATDRFYKLRMAARGSWIPARLWSLRVIDPETGELTQDVEFFAEIDGSPTSAFEPDFWPWRQISEAEWRFLTDECAHARKYLPRSPMANPTIPANQIEPEFF